jgi:FAD/FMN-containing dehydrogenase
MALNRHTFYELKALKAHILTGEATFYHASQTSTVIPYDKLEQQFSDEKNFSIVDLGQLPASMNLDGDDEIVLKGGVCWKDYKEFCQANQKSIMTSPTEELANVLAGVATSCTGERCFSFGTLRNQVKELSYIDYKGEEINLDSFKRLEDHSLFQDESSVEILKNYQASYKKYKNFKNAPFPRLELETDLMIGTEGQLGVITSTNLISANDENLRYMFLAISPWEKDRSAHLEIFDKIQKFRNEIWSCELIDSNSWDYLPEGEAPVLNKDLIFLEIREVHFEKVYNEYLSKLELVSEESIFEITKQRYHNLRMSVPRATFERNSKMGVVKKGTDVQVGVKDFGKLLDYYQKMSKFGIEYNLFGHFGDAHLHFNYMPTAERVNECQDQLNLLYGEVLKWQGSPFAEHGIGIIKQNFITKFWGKPQFEMFKYLKTKMDPQQQFFPQGFMNIKGNV